MRVSAVSRLRGCEGAQFLSWRFEKSVSIGIRGTCDIVNYAPVQDRITGGFDSKAFFFQASSG